MSARSSTCVSVLALALAVLLLFFAGDAQAISWKISYTTTLSDTAAGANADVVHNLNVAAPHALFTRLDATSAPSEWYTATDAALPDGAAVGEVVATTTMAILGSCQTTLVTAIPLYDATTAETNTADWAGDGSNLTTDPDGNGLPLGLEKYPSFLNAIFGGLKPRSRAYGYVTPMFGTPPVQVNFVVFNPGEFVGSGSSWPGFPKPEQEMGDALGYMNFAILNNPVLGQATPAVSPGGVRPREHRDHGLGRTKGEGEAIPAVAPWAEPAYSCGDGLDSDDDAGINDGCFLVTAACNDDEDNDSTAGRTRTAGSCGLPTPPRTPASSARTPTCSMPTARASGTSTPTASPTMRTGVPPRPTT
jgi:hypothetical protein